MSAITAGLVIPLHPGSMSIIEIRAFTRAAALFAVGRELETVAEILKVVDQPATVAFVMEGERCVASSLALGRDADSMEWRTRVSGWAKGNAARRIAMYSYQGGALQDLRWNGV